MATIAQRPDHRTAVVIAAMNAAGTIRRAVASALAEPEVAEVIVVDDASTDDTARAAQAVEDGSSRLHVLRKEVNGGPAAARNLAIRLTTAPLIALLDADDYFLPGRLSRLLAEAGEDWDLAADDIVVVPEAIASEVSLPPPTAAGSRPHAIGLEAFVLGNLTRRTSQRGELGFLKPVMRRAFLERHGLGYDEALRLGEDYALYVRVLAAGARFVLVPSAGYVAVARAGSLSARHTTDDLARIAAFDAACLQGFADLTPGERRAVTLHRDATLRKVALGRVLDAKRQGGWMPALRELARRPGAAPSIVAASLGARLHRLLPRSGAHDGPHATRLLIGDRVRQLTRPSDTEFDRRGRLRPAMRPTGSGAR